MTNQMILNNVHQTNNVTSNKLPETDADILSTAQNLVAWAQHESSINIEDFALGQMIAPSKFVKLCDTNDVLNQAYEIALRKIGSRRKKLALNGDINHQIVLAEMPMYDPAFRAWQLSQKNVDGEPGQVKYVMIHDLDLKAPTEVKKE